VLVFARDLTRAAHDARGNQRTENQTFAALANDLITQENATDARLTYLLANGATLSRPVFDARLVQINHSLSSWTSAASLFETPTIGDGLNETLATETRSRVIDFSTVLSQVASALYLPWTAPSTIAPSPDGDLAATSAAWNARATAFHRATGHVTLDTLTNSTGPLAANGYGALASAPSLRLVRGIGIAAVQVNPSPLPATPGNIIEPPTTQLHLGVSVHNGAFAEQPVTVIVTLSPTNGLGQSVQYSQNLTLGPLANAAIVVGRVPTVPLEHAKLTVVVSGAPATGTLSTSRSYDLTVAPSGQ
jgi:hypothetical protein